jgi:hypothetical protein
MFDFIVWSFDSESFQNFRRNNKKRPRSQCLSSVAIRVEQRPKRTALQPRRTDVVFHSIILFTHPLHSPLVSPPPAGRIATRPSATAI